MLTYNDFVPTVPDRRSWTLPQVLKWRAGTHSERIFLDVPGDGVRMSFAETYEVAQHIASGLLERGHEPGDRLIIMMGNNALQGSRGVPPLRRGPPSTQNVPGATPAGLRSSSSRQRDTDILE